MIDTKIFEKLSASVINVSIALAVSLPIGLHWGFGISWKLGCIAIFFAYELIFIFTQEKRDLGMMLISSYWRKPFTAWQYVAYNILYTVSFSTLLFRIWLPFDLLVINLVLIQLTCIKMTGATLHGYISAMATLKAK